VKHLTIVVKPFRAEAVLQVISEMGVLQCLVREAKGYGRQKGYLDKYRGGDFSAAYLPKVEITVCIERDRYEELAQRITKIARTGRIGDGKVFVVPMAWELIEF
jgi:nitrogen regulatory protein P-II 2